MKKNWPFATFVEGNSADNADQLRSFLFIVPCLFFLFLVASPQLRANDAPALIQGAEINRLAKSLTETAADSGMIDDVCRLYLADREGVIGALVAVQSLEALSDAITDELSRTRPGSGCEVVVMKTTGQLSRGGMLKYPQTKNRPGSVFALAFFPSRFGVMMFANGYKPDGRSAVFSDRIDVAIEAANEPASSDREGLGGPALPVRQQNPIDDSQPPFDGAREDVQLKTNKKPFLDRLREKAGTERAE